MHLDLITIFMGSNAAFNMIAHLANRAREPQLRQERIEDQESLRAKSEIMSNYPLQLHPTQLASRYQAAQLRDILGFPALLVIVAPVTCRDASLSADALGLMGNELRIDELLRHHLDSYIASNRIELQAGIWKPQTTQHGKAAVSYLHEVFTDIPALIIQPMIEGDRLYLTAGHWNAWREDCAYEDLAVFPIKDTLDTYARDEVKHWRTMSEHVNNQKLTFEEREIFTYNMPLADLQDSDEANGIAGRVYTYRRTPAQYKRFITELALCVGVTIAGVADAYHRVGAGRREYLPQILPQLLAASNHHALIDRGIASLQVSFQTIKDARMHADFTDEMRNQLNTFKGVAAILRQKLPPETMGAIEEDIARFEKLTFNLAVFGATNAGKSSLLNALLGYAQNDPKRPFTNDPRAGTWSTYSEATNGVAYQPDPNISMRIYDTPGIAGDDPAHLRRAQQISMSADIILYVVWQQVQGEEQNTALRALVATGKPMIIAINQVDRMRPQEIAATKAALLEKIPEIDKDMFVDTAGDPFTGPPQLADLVERLVMLIHGHQGSLITRTIEQHLGHGAELAAAIIEEELRRFEETQRAQVAAMEQQLAQKQDTVNNIIAGWANWTAGTAAIIPFGVDVIATVPMFATMFIDILNVYGKHMDRATITTFTKDLLKSFLAIFMMSAGTMFVSDWLATIFKTNPLTYIFGMALDGVFTYFLAHVFGDTFAHYCKNDLSWGAHKTAEETLRFYIKKHVHVNFLDRLPSPIRAKVAERFAHVM